VRNATAQFTLGVPLYAGGGVKNSIPRRRDARACGAGRLGAAPKARSSAKVVAAYMEVIYQEALVSLAGSNVDVLQVNLQATSDRFEIGDLTRTDVAPVRGRLALARGELRTAQANLVRARENYIVVVGGAPGDARSRRRRLPGLPMIRTPRSTSRCRTTRPARRARARAGGGLRHPRRPASRLPRVDATAGADYQTFLGSLPGELRLLSNDSSGATAGLRATLPIFQGGRAAALIRQSQARQSIALENASPPSAT
jgi:outer membrane protein